MKHRLNISIQKTTKDYFYRVTLVQIYVDTTKCQSSGIRLNIYLFYENAFVNKIAFQGFNAKK